MQEWEKKMREEHLEIRKISEELESVFRKTGYTDQEAAALAWDLAELIGACRECSERILRLSKRLDEGMGDYLVELTTLESFLEDLKGHLHDSLASLPKYISFLPEYGQT